MAAYNYRTKMINFPIYCAVFCVTVLELCSGRALSAYNNENLDINQKTLQLLDDVDQHFKFIDTIDDLIFVFGTPGVPKSQFVSFLALNSQFRTDKILNILPYARAERDSPFQIVVRSLKTTSNLYSKTNLHVIDYPYLIATPDVSYEIASTYFLDKVFSMAKTVKIIFTLDYTNKTKNSTEKSAANYVKNLLCKAANKIQNIHEIRRSISFVVVDRESFTNVYNTSKMSTLSSNTSILTYKRGLSHLQKLLKSDPKKVCNTESTRIINSVSRMIKTLAQDVHISPFWVPASSKSQIIPPYLKNNNTALKNQLSKMVYSNMKNRSLSVVLSSETKNAVQSAAIVKNIESKFVSSIDALINGISKSFNDQRSTSYDFHTHVASLVSDIKSIPDYNNKVNITEEMYFDALNACTALTINDPYSNFLVIELKHFYYQLKFLEKHFFPNKNIIKIALQLNKKLFLYKKSHELLLNTLDILQHQNFSTTQNEYAFQTEQLETSLFRNNLSFGRHDEKASKADSIIKQLNFNINGLKAHIESNQLTIFENNIANDVNRLYTNVESNYSYSCISDRIMDTNIVQIKGIKISLCQLNSDLKKESCYHSATELNIYVLDTIVIDCDLDFIGREMQISIIAPLWEVRGNRKIILNGENAKPLPVQKAKNSERYPQNGQHGRPGNNGQTAGSFFGIGQAFVSGENLEIIANGGDGGDGQDGGDGADGRKATMPDLPVPAGRPNFYEYIENLHRKNQYHTYNIHEVSKKLILLVVYNQLNFEYIVKFTNNDGTTGSSGGDGGSGGHGGKAGRVEVLNVGMHSNTTNVKIVSNDGRMGNHGAGGQGGLGANEKATRTFKCFANEIIVTPIIPLYIESQPKITSCENHNEDFHDLNEAGHAGVLGGNHVGLEDLKFPSNISYPDQLIQYKTFYREKNLVLINSIEDFLVSIHYHQKILESYKPIDLLQELIELELQYSMMIQKDVDVLAYYEFLRNFTLTVNSSKVNEMAMQSFKEDEIVMKSSEVEEFDFQSSEAGEIEIKSLEGGEIDVKSLEGEKDVKSSETGDIDAESSEADDRVDKSSETGGIDAKSSEADDRVGKSSETGDIDAKSSEADDIVDESSEAGDIDAKSSEIDDIVDKSSEVGEVDVESSEIRKLDVESSELSEMDVQSSEVFKREVKSSDESEIEVNSSEEGKINTYNSNINEIGSRKLIRVLLIAIQTKIIQINSGSSKILLTDIDLYVDQGLRNIEKVDKLGRTIAIQNLKDNFTSVINDKINEVNTFIETDVRVGFERVGDELKSGQDAIIKTIENWKKQSKKDKKKLEEAQQLLLDNMTKRKIFCVLDISNKLISMLGPVGATVSKALGVGISLGKKFTMKDPVNINTVDSDMEIVNHVNYTVDNLNQIRSTGSGMQKLKAMINMTKDVLTHLPPDITKDLAQIIDHIKGKINKPDFSIKDIATYKKHLCNGMSKIEYILNTTKNEKLLGISKTVSPLFKYISDVSDVADIAIDFYNAFKGDLDTLNDVQNKIIQENLKLRELNLEEDKVYNQVYPMFDEIQTSMSKIPAMLKGQSSAALDIGQWKMQLFIANLDKSLTKMVSRYGDGVIDLFRNCLTQYKELSQLTVSLYDRIQKFQEQKQLANFIGGVGSASFKSYVESDDPEINNKIEKLDLATTANTIIGQYKIIKSSFLQFLFPYATNHLVENKYLDGSETLKSILEITNEARREIEGIKSEITTIKSSIGNEDSNIIFNDFETGRRSSHPFYSWDSELFTYNFESLLSGNQTRFFANIVNRRGRANSEHARSSHLREF